MSKIFLAFLIVGCLALSFISCGNGSVNNEESNAPGISDETLANSGSVEAEYEEQIQNGGTVTFSSNGDGTCVLKSVSNISGPDFVVPAESAKGDRVISIGDGAFWMIDGIVEITIPDGVETIGSMAFFQCTDLERVNIPDGVKSISTGVFAGCNKLVSVDLPNSVKELNGAFMQCEGIVSVKIPSGIEKIVSSSFLGCLSLEKVILPASVVSIEEFAFYSCPKLATVCFEGSEEQWQEISGLENLPDGVQIVFDFETE